MKTKILLSAILIHSIVLSYGQWSYTELSEAKSYMGSCSQGSKAYFAGGKNGSNTFKTVETYDVSSGEWDIIGELTISRGVLSAVSCGNKVFFAGGFDWNISYSTIDIYDIESQQWSVAQLFEDRFSMAAVSNGSKVLFAGGFRYPTQIYSAVVDIYDAQKDDWTTSSLSLAREGIAAAVVGNLAIFAGGKYGSNSTTNIVDIYNFNTGEWSTETLSQARGFASATTIGNKVYIAGGITSLHNPSDRVDIYNSLTGTWETDSLSAARCSQGNSATVNGKAYFAGGGNFMGAGYYNPSNVVDIYDPVSDIWSVDTLSQELMAHSVVGVGNYFIVAGGEHDQGIQVSTVEIFYDPPQSRIIHVPDDYPTIQEGIDAANNGDTVLVADGLYYENINFLGKKPLMVASEFLLDGDTSHISNTIIDGSQPVDPNKGSVVTFESGEDTTSVLCGFTLTGGIGTIEPSVNMRMGGGMHIKFSGGKFLNNYIHDNSVSYNGGVYGGGMQLGGPVSEIPWIVLRGNRINNNVAKSSAEAASGGGFFCFYNLIMEYNEISHNEAIGYLGGDGAGAAIGGAFGLIQVDVHDNIVMYNEAKTDIGTNNYATLGGGISFYWDITGNVSYNVITDNSLEAPGTYWSFGAGVFVQDITSKDFIFENNLIEDNIATTEKCFGGGLSLLRSVGTYQNNVLINNTASHGGGLSAVKEEKESGIPALISNTTPGEGFSTKNGEKDGDIPILFNNTITGNEANNGNGIYLQSVANAFVMNSIIWGNFPPGGDNIKLVNSNIEVRYCDVELIDGGIWPGEGNMNVDPEFQSDGYHLDCKSTVLNGGASTVLINGEYYDSPLYDIDGDERPFEWTNPDIGADEAPCLYVSVDEYFTSNIIIYPNPANKFVKIDIINGATIQEVIIFNQTGQKVYRGIPENNTLDISKLQPGMYVVEVVTKDGNLRKKMVVQ